MIVFMLLVHSMQAQTWGIKGGVNFASMRFSAGGLDFSPESVTGIHIGIIGEFNLQESLYFNTGLLYSLKGYKIEGSLFDLEETDEEKLTVNYLEIPMNLAYKFPIKDNSSFFIQAGPYLGYALSGKSKSEGLSEELDFGDQGMRRFDFGLGFGAGVGFGALVTSLHYQLGLANLFDITEVEIDNMNVKNRVFQVSVAYMFGKTR